MGLGGIVRNFFRLITFGLVFGDYKSSQAMDRLWTSSPDAIRAGFAKRREEMLKWLRGLQESYAQALGALKSAEKELAEIAKGLDEALPRREEAVRQYNAAKTAGDAQRVAELETIFTNIDLEVQRLEGRKTEVVARIERNRTRATEKKGAYMDFQARVTELGQKEADAIQDYITAHTDIQFAAQDRQFKTESEKDEVDVIMTNIEELKSRAAVITETSGANLATEYAHLDRDARRNVAASRLSQMSAAMDAANKVTTGEAGAKTAPASTERTGI